MGKGKTRYLKDRKQLLGHLKKKTKRLSQSCFITRARGVWIFIDVYGLIYSGSGKGLCLRVNAEGNVIIFVKYKNYKSTMVYSQLEDRFDAWALAELGFKLHVKCMRACVNFPSPFGDKWGRQTVTCRSLVTAMWYGWEKHYWTWGEQQEFRIYRSDKDNTSYGIDNLVVDKIQTRKKNSLSREFVYYPDTTNDGRWDDVAPVNSDLFTPFNREDLNYS
ncbi:hypothetical protein C162_00255 [Paenibacillus sp. FSL R7-269]|uniref:hypothetical protein n=1 Tax=Paenibacillus sp. FSL R7-269 TaxID=1226755 RepID=UPI0003E1D5AD|nr:hypothetical protein [Paenibacillus sp. FSL R7-269]ETT56797.1 hypothetical protein C162_00255 [Paenibacillus sp. FSL R7-269]